MRAGVRGTWWVLVGLFAGGIGCAEPKVPAPGSPIAHSTPAVRAQAWPSGSALFRRDGRWVGADSAYSIAIEPQRVLWLFADTFVDPAADGRRSNGPNFFLRNSVAIQDGPSVEAARDAARARMTFSWSTAADSTPRSFFTDVDEAERWVWPLHGARLPGGPLLLFRMHVHKLDGGLGFGLAGWDAVAVDAPDTEPSTWQPRLVQPAIATDAFLLGVSVLLHEDELYVYAVRNDDREHAIYLARFSITDLARLAAGSLADPEWFTGDAGFVRKSAGAVPRMLFRDGQTELSVHWDVARRRFIEVQMRGLWLSDPKTALAYRTAPEPQGPWSALHTLMRPKEAARPDVAQLVAYAGKAHPEQRGKGLVVSYVVHDLRSPLPPDALYYPELVCVTLP